MKELIIELFAITALFVIPAIIGLIAIRSWFKGRDRLYNSIDAAIERGAPPEVIAQLVALTESKDDKLPNRKKYFVNGFLLLSIGIAFTIIYLRGVNENLIYPAVFASLLGLGHIIIAAFILKDDGPESE